MKPHDDKLIWEALTENGYDPKAEKPSRAAYNKMKKENPSAGRFIGGDNSKVDEGGQRPPQGDRRLTGHHEASHQASTSGGEAGALNAVREVAEALRDGRISLKEVDLSAGTLVVSTGGEKSIILKAVGYEGDHDIPISQRPDSAGSRHRMSRRTEPYDDDWKPKPNVGGSPQDYEGGQSFGDDR
jgi:hypothetical protein